MSRPNTSNHSGSNNNGEMRNGDDNGAAVNVYMYDVHLRKCYKVCLSKLTSHCHTCSPKRNPEKCPYVWPYANPSVTMSSLLGNKSAPHLNPCNSNPALTPSSWPQYTLIQVLCPVNGLMTPYTGAGGPKCFRAEADGWSRRSTRGNGWRQVNRICNTFIPVYPSLFCCISMYDAVTRCKAVHYSMKQKGSRRIYSVTYHALLTTLAYQASHCTTGHRTCARLWKNA